MFTYPHFDYLEGSENYNIGVSFIIAKLALHLSDGNINTSYNDSCASAISRMKLPNFKNNF